MAQTSLNSTGVASTGALSLQSNGTTEAIGISTGQVATFAQNPVLTSGTANGVGYLNGSKVLTTGSALTFDGSRLATTGRFNSAGLYEDSSGNLGLGVTPSAWSTGKALEINTVGNSIWGLSDQLNIANNAYYNAGWKYAGTGLAVTYQQNAGKHVWSTAGSGTAGNAITFTQAMTLDASGRLLVGTTTALVGGNITVGDGSGTTTSQQYLNAGSGGSSLVGRMSGSNTWFIGDTVAALGSGSGFINYVYGANPWIVYTNGAERARIDSSGNLIHSAPTTPPSLATNGTMVFNLTSNTNLRVSVRGSDGVTRTANLTLA